MRQFYEQIHADAQTKRFFVQCPICGKKQTKIAVPMICRSRNKIAQCETGKAGRISQNTFNHAKASAVQYHARFFNECRSCHRWVCDDCYDTDSPTGTCMDCSKAPAK